MAKARKKEKKTRLRPPRTLQKKKNRKIRARSLSFLSLSLSLFHASAEDPPVAASAFLDRFFAAKRPEARAASAAAKSPRDSGAARRPESRAPPVFAFALVLVLVCDVC